MDMEKFSMYLATVISPEVVGLLSQKLGLGEIETMRKFFNSDVYAALSEEKTKMWHYSPQLISSLAEEEFKTGKFAYPQEAL